VKPTRSCCDEAGVHDVLFTGYVPIADLPRYYRSADVFCAPATGQESFGIVLLEAMAAGRSIVASNIEGYASVLSHGDEGLLVEPRSEEALAVALVHLLADPGLRAEMGERGRVKARDYSWDHVAERVLAYYQRLMSEVAPGRH